MRNQKPMTVSSNLSDTNGMDDLFIEPLSDDNADSKKKRTMEVSIREAAKLLGISERTVWRRVLKKELKAKTRNNKRVISVPVLEPSIAVTEDCHVNVSDTAYNANAVLDLRLLLMELQGANYRIGYLESENKSYQKQVLLLPDLEAQANKAKDQERDLVEMKAELERLKGSWWYRLSRFLSDKSD